MWSRLSIWVYKKSTMVYTSSRWSIPVEFYTYLCDKLFPKDFPPMTKPSRLLSFFIVPVVLLSVAMISCSRTHNLDPFGWESIGEPFDSLTYQLERAWLDEIPLSQRRQLVEIMSEAAVDLRDIPQAAVKAEFWEGRLSRALGDE